MILKITKEEYYKLFSIKKAIVVFTHITFSGLSSRILNTLQNTNHENSEITVFNVELSEDETLADELNITSIPCIIAYENGREKGRIDDLNVLNIVVDMYEGGIING